MDWMDWVLLLLISLFLALASLLYSPSPRRMRGEEIYMHVVAILA